MTLITEVEGVTFLPDKLPGIGIYLPVKPQIRQLHQTIVTIGGYINLIRLILQRCKQSSPVILNILLFDLEYTCPRPGHCQDPEPGTVVGKYSLS